MERVRLQFERLRRHYQNAVTTFDHVTFLDLSHTLRIWTELKRPLQELAPTFSKSVAFRTGVPSKKVTKAARGRTHVLCYLGGAVHTLAAKSELLAGPELDEGQDFLLGVGFKMMPPAMEFRRFAFIAGHGDSSLLPLLSSENASPCNFIQWLGAEVVRVGFLSEDGTYQSKAIPREILIKRVANTLDGSHASVAPDTNSSEENSFDAPIKFLLQYRIGGVPVPYFILLKIAQDILDIGGKTGLIASR